jgi:hypothetical protein
LGDNDRSAGLAVEYAGGESMRMNRVTIITGAAVSATIGTELHFFLRIFIHKIADCERNSRHFLRSFFENTQFLPCPHKW